MLVVTDKAASIIREITAGREGDRGLRISLDPADGALAVAVASAPAAGDEVVEGGGAAVYVAADAWAPLNGKALDASVDAVDGTVTFTVAEW